MDVLEVVLAGATDDQAVGHGSAFVGSDSGGQRAPSGRAFGVEPSDCADNAPGHRGRTPATSTLAMCGTSASPEATAITSS